MERINHNHKNGTNKQLTISFLGLWLVLLILRRSRVLFRGLRLHGLDLCQVDLVLSHCGSCDTARDLVNDVPHRSLHCRHPGIWVLQEVVISFQSSLVEKKWERMMTLQAQLRLPVAERGDLLPVIRVSRRVLEGRGELDQVEGVVLELVVDGLVRNRHMDEDAQRHDAVGQFSFREGSALAHCQCWHSVGKHGKVVHQVSEQ